MTSTLAKDFLITHHHHHHHDDDDKVVERVVQFVRDFYRQHTEIKASHGWPHVARVYDHARRACAVHQCPVLTPRQAAEVQMAALLHDVDDRKYFALHANYENARALLHSATVDADCVEAIVQMIGWVSCAHNGNRVPEVVQRDNAWHLLIPRWADRLEAVGKIGVVRCWQYNTEHNRPLATTKSPRAQTEAEVWAMATPERFEAYLQQPKKSTTTDNDDDDMISHYYDKLLHVARPPPEIVQNPYLEAAARESAAPLVQVCLSFGQTGSVDTAAIEQLAKELGMSA